MHQTQRPISFMIVLLAAALVLFNSSLKAAPLSMLTTDGGKLVDATGKQVILKGCNLGNELILESWMFGGTLLIDGKPFHDGLHVYNTLVKRFGQSAADALLNTYRTSWITARDFENIKSFGFNVVRLPFDYRQLQNDEAPYTIKPDGFQWMDHTIKLARAQGMYVILDMHGVPGGQSNEDHTGQAGQNKLWNSALNQQRTADIWHAIADHYKNQSAVAAYDLINEPYGDHRSDGKAVLTSLMPKIYKAIRSTGDQHIMYFPAGLNTGIRFYGNPKAQNMTNVGFTEHYYPGLYGSKSTIETQARTINQILPSKAQYLGQIGAPYFVGEFNVVLQSEASDRMLREYFDRFAHYGWAGTMWSYKLIKQQAGYHPDAWYMVTNDDTIVAIDMASASQEDISTFFSSMATMKLVKNASLQESLTRSTPTPFYLTPYPALPTAAASTPVVNPPGYSSVDIGTIIPGHTAIQADGGVLISAGGDDINATADSCRFVYTTAATSSATVRATFTSLLDTQEYAKAGVMARWGNPADASKPDAAMAMLNVFPDGTVAFISRAIPGGSTTETKLTAGLKLPVELRLTIDPHNVSATYRTVANGSWTSVGKPAPHPAGPLLTGLAACAHTDSVLTNVTAYLDDKADTALAKAQTATVTQASILQNGSFEQAGESDDTAASWNRWGDWINRETGWNPTHSGTCEIGYHHWQITTADSSGLWQDVTVEPGKPYTFSIFAAHDFASAGQHDPSTLELRMESVTPDGQITLNSQDFDIAKLATGKEWSHLSLTATTETDKLRVLVIINAAAEAPRGGAVKLDDAALTPPGNSQVMNIPASQTNTHVISLR